MRMTLTFGLLLCLSLLTWVILAPSATPAGWTIVSQREFSLTVVQGVPHSLSPDSAWLLTAGDDSGLCLYRTEDLSSLGCFKPEVETKLPLWLSRVSIVWAPDSKCVVFASTDGRLWLIDLDEGRLEWLPASVGAKAVAWSPDGKYLAVGGGGAIVVAPPGALAEAPIARYEGVLEGLEWNKAGLYYGVLAPDRKTFQIWHASPYGGTEPELLWSYAYPSLFLQAVSADGRFAWIRFDLVDLEEGEFVHVRERESLHSFVFSPDEGWWLYAYRTVSRDGGIYTVYRLAVRPAGAPEGEEQVLLEGERQISILGWSGANLVGVLLVSGKDPAVGLLQLAPVEQ